MSGMEHGKRRTGVEVEEVEEAAAAAAAGCRKRRRGWRRRRLRDAVNALR